MRRLAVPFLALLIPFLVAGCETPQKPAFPDLTWSHLEPLSLNVAKVEVVPEFTAPLAPPHVEHRFPTPPAKALRRWAEDRLEATGNSGVARFVIKDASVVEVELPKTKGLKGYFTTEQAQRYDATIAVTLEIRNARGFRDGYVSARAERSRSVPEDITLNERERVWFEMTEAMMQDLNAELERQIREHLARFLA